MVDIRRVYLLEPELLLLNVEVYRGKLVYRAKGSSRRISYDRVKKWLVKQAFSVEEEVPDWIDALFPALSKGDLSPAMVV